ncbi:hypothetical protein HanIR_Chr01g0021651 [Helianthus annuus]|nr:hypothetical protein HanIR_Chr01g0021651 [Helianthus annuus]
MYFRKLVDHSDISVKKNKYPDSMPTIEGFARYIPPLCGNIVLMVCKQYTKLMLRYFEQLW